MTNKNISALTAATTPLAGTELLAIWDASGTTKQVSITNVTAGRGVSASTFTTSGRVSLGNTANSTASGPTLKLDGSGAGSDQIALYEASSDKWHINSSSGVLGLYNITTASYAVTISAANIFAIAGAATVGTTLGITGTTTAAAINASGAISATPSISIGSTANEWTGAPSAVNPLIQANGTTSYGTISGASSRADGTGLRVGSFTGEYQTNSVNHKTIGAMDFVTTGTTANQRGGGWNLTLKADGSTSKTVVISATVAGGVSVTGTFSATGVVTMSNYGVGTATFSAAGVISSVSDERLKIKDGTIADPIPMIMALEPGYYFGKPEANMGDGRQLGFYAQNVRKAIGPEAAPDPEDQVSLDADGNEISRKTRPWGYYDRSVLAVAIEALKVHEGRLAALQADFQAYKNSHP